MLKQTNKFIKNLLPDFIDYLEVERGLAEKTQVNYSRYLQKFVQWLEHTRSPEIRPHELTADHVWRYRLYLAREARKGTLKKVTQNYYLIALRSLLNYFAEKDIASLPSQKIQLAKDARTSQNVKYLTLEQIEKLLLAPDVSTPDGLRDRAILETLFSTGLRVAELSSLNRDIVPGDDSKKFLETSITGKGNRTRTVYFSERCLTWIREYLKTRQDMDPALFIHYRARSGSNTLRLTIRSIERIVKKYSIRAGTPLFASPHTLRHSYATDLMAQGVDVRLVQEFLGHKNIATTQIYTHVTSKQLRDVHKKFHSGGRMKNN